MSICQLLWMYQVPTGINGSCGCVFTVRSQWGSSGHCPSFTRLCDISLRYKSHLSLYSCPDLLCVSGCRQVVCFSQILNVWVWVRVPGCDVLSPVVAVIARSAIELQADSASLASVAESEKGWSGAKDGSHSKQRPLETVLHIWTVAALGGGHVLHLLLYREATKH